MKPLSPPLGECGASFVSCGLGIVGPVGIFTRMICSIAGCRRVGAAKPSLSDSSVPSLRGAVTNTLPHAGRTAATVTSVDFGPDN